MASGIGRRQFISALGARAAWPLAAGAQRLVFAGAGSLVAITSGGTAGSIYPFPNAVNTGVPPGTTLTPFAGSSRITTNGAVLSGYIFTNTLTIAANNVAIENCYFPINGTCIQVNNLSVTATFDGTDVMTVIVGSGIIPGMAFDSITNNIPFNTTVVNQLTGRPGGVGTYTLSNPVPAQTATSIAPFFTGTLITHCECNDTASSNSDQAIQGGYFTATYNNMHGYCKDFNCHGSGVIIEHNYLWNESGGGHAENINCNGAGQVFNFSNNTVVNNAGQTTTIFVSDNFGPVNNVTINGNLLVGGGSFTLYAGTTPSGYPHPPITNIFVTNNVMGSATIAGGYGYQYGGGNPSTQFSNNVDMFTGQIIDPRHYMGTMNFVKYLPNPNIVIASFTPTNSFTLDSSTFGQNIATSNIITLKGCTLAGDSVSIYDGATALGTTMANWRTGVWTFQAPQTGTLAPGLHTFTAKDTTANTTSEVFSVRIPS
jgi:hypothetical protein